MVAISEVRASNASLKSLPAGLVAIFVGGTSGIGLFTARELVRNTTSPKIYLLGRSQAEAIKIIDELKTINSSSQVSFIQKDVSLLKNVDEACQEIKNKEKQINLLFMTCGYYTLKGREETAEGLDRKFALHYYTRMRFINQLQPLLTAASNSGGLSRVVAVLDPQPGLGNVPNFSDLSLKTGFSLKACAVHASSMTNFAFSNLANQYPTTSFVHSFPFIVETNVGRDAWGAFKPVVGAVLGILLKPWSVKQAESGERHLFASTAPRFAPKADDEDEGTAIGSDGLIGSGSYFLNWNDETLETTKRFKVMKEEGAEQKVWEHTEEVFRKVCEAGGKY
jgi:NAD(P)-dependent dehydrogenase (short-subunit alcohol dehydrogenase family)